MREGGEGGRGKGRREGGRRGRDKRKVGEKVRVRGRKGVRRV